MISGYPGRASVVPGDRLRLHVATDAPRFRVRFFRWGDGFVPMGASAWRAGERAEPRGPADDWAWPAHEFPVPREWPSGVYVAHLQEPRTADDAVSFDAPAALFVVRAGAARSPLLYKIPLATYHAYNANGGGCFYIDPPRSQSLPGSKVSLRRPGGGIGGGTHGALDHYDPSSARQTFAHWDAPFIRWLLRNGYSPEFCTDLDVHDDERLLDAPHRLLVSVGHDEYWTETMRDRVEAFVANRGGNVAFFGANVCWWRIHLVDGGTAIVCHQGGPRGALDHWWAPTGANRPEDALTGVSYRHGGGWWDGPRRTRGFFIQQPDHWVFAGTGLRRGEVFGERTSPPLVGYECDGAPIAHFDEATGIATLAADAERSGTPPGFRLLAVGPLGADWQELPPREGRAAGEGVHAATMGIFSRDDAAAGDDGGDIGRGGGGDDGVRGTVLTVGTTDWAQVLATGEDRRVAQITRNVLDRLLPRVARPLPPSRAPG